MEKTIGKTTLRLVTGDIADQDTHAVVTAAHWRLNKGMGTDGTIHSKGGPAIYEECRRIGGCPIGDAVITTGGNLKARYVIHAVGPVWHGGGEDEPKLLASAYRRSLEVAVQNGLRSISFPSISTGAFGYPIQLAAPVALKAIVGFLREQQHQLEEVRMVLYTRENDKAYAIYVQALEELGSGADGGAMHCTSDKHENPRDATRPHVVSADHLDSAGPPLRILYIENHTVFATNVINQFLARHTVTVASSLAEARRSLETGRFNLLLVDYDLDDGKGDTLLKELHASGKAIPVIGVSSHDEGNTALLRAGAVAVCNKMQFDRIQSVIDTSTAYTKPTASGLVWWVVPGALAGMPMPYIHPERRLKNYSLLTAYEDDLPVLYAAGIRAVVCLLNSPSDAAVYDSAGFAFKCLPVPDGGAPTMEQAQGFISFVDRQLADHRPVAVHCEGGIGRTGTLLAAYFVAKGESAKSAIDRVRAAKRSAVETPRQIQFLEQFAASRQPPPTVPFAEPSR